MDKLILLKCKNPIAYEIHRGSINQTRNLILTTHDLEFANQLVNGFNSVDTEVIKLYERHRVLMDLWEPKSKHAIHIRIGKELDVVYARLKEIDELGLGYIK